MPSPVPLIFLAFSWFGYRLFFQASAQMPTRGIYSDVTLPYSSSGSEQVAAELPAIANQFAMAIDVGQGRCVPKQQMSALRIENTPRVSMR